MKPSHNADFDGSPPMKAINFIIAEQENVENVDNKMEIIMIILTILISIFLMVY